MSNLKKLISEIQEIILSATTDPHRLLKSGVTGKVSRLESRYGNLPQAQILLMKYYILCCLFREPRRMQDLGAATFWIQKVLCCQGGDLRDSDRRLIEESIEPLVNLALNTLHNSDNLQKKDFQICIELLDIEKSILNGDEIQRLENLGTLALVHRMRYERYGGIEDLNESVNIGLMLRNDSIPDRIRGAALSNLSGSYLLRFQNRGEIADIEEAVNCGYAAMQFTNRENRDYAGRISNLANALTEKYKELKDPDDLEEAFRLAQEAVSLLDDSHPDLPGRLSNLSKTIRAGYSLKSSRSEIDVMIAHLRRSVNLVAEGHRDLALFQSALGSALQLRFEYFGEPSNLSESIKWKELALSGTSEEKPEFAIFQSSLSDSLQARYRESGQAEDAEDALMLAQSSVESPLAALWLRCDTACRGAVFASECGNHEEAFGLAQSAMNLMGEMASGVAGLRSTQLQLAKLTGMASDMAAVAIECNREMEALGFLEQGRTVMQNQVLGVRTDLDRLRTDMPEIIPEFEAIRAELDTDITSQEIGEEEAVAKRIEVRRAWGELLTRIRRHPELTDFLLPPSPYDLCKFTESNPIVILNVSTLRCDALIIREGYLQVLPLPDLSIPARHNAARWGQAVADSTDFDTLNEILSWMWNAFVKSVLDELHLPNKTSENPDDRIWWIHTGSLTALPIHATRVPLSEGFANLFDYLVSSYATSVRALAHINEHPDRTISFDSPLIAGVKNISDDDIDVYLMGRASSKSVLVGALGVCDETEQA